MDKIDFIAGLRAAAAELQPFTKDVQSGGRIWNGTAYIQSAPKQADSYALAWWSVLMEIADLLETQDAALSLNQAEHLRRKLFGGMGSFADYCVDTTQWGDAAKIANQRLNEIRTGLFQNLAVEER